MVKIYTKVGDHGQTKQVTGQMVDKDDAQIETLGAFDELQSWIGVVIAALTAGTAGLADELADRQRELYQLQSDIAVPRSHRIGADLTTRLEERIDDIMATTPRLKEFILPGGSPAGAGLQYARTLARRAERQLVTLHKASPQPDAIMTYVNRLSDYLFALALYVNYREGYQEVPSKKRVDNNSGR